MDQILWRKVWCECTVLFRNVNVYYTNANKLKYSINLLKNYQKVVFSSKFRQAKICRAKNPRRTQARRCPCSTTQEQHIVQHNILVLCCDCFIPSLECEITIRKDSPTSRSRAGLGHGDPVAPRWRSCGASREEALSSYLQLHCEV